MTSFFACEREQRESLVSRRRRAGGLGLRRTNLKLEDAYSFYEQEQDIVHVHLLSELGDHLGRGVILCWEKRRRAVQLEPQKTAAHRPRGPQVGEAYLRLRKETP